MAVYQFIVYIRIKGEDLGGSMKSTGDRLGRKQSGDISGIEERVK